MFNSRAGTDGGVQLGVCAYVFGGRMRGARCVLVEHRVEGGEVKNEVGMEGALERR
jgi:hypothetical protein